MVEIYRNFKDSKLLRLIARWDVFNMLREDDKMLSKKFKKILLMLIPISSFSFGYKTIFAEEKNIITSEYTIQIPSVANISNGELTSFTVNGKAEAQVDLDITASSKNNYMLKCGSSYIPYTLNGGYQSFQFRK